MSEKSEEGIHRSGPRKVPNVKTRHWADIGYEYDVCFFEAQFRNDNEIRDPQMKP